MDTQADERSAATLFENARAGNREAFGQLLELYRGRLETFAYLSLGPRLRTRVDYEDVVQDTCVKAFQLHGEFEWQGSRSFYRWLARILGHVIQNEARRHRDVALQVPSDRGPADGSSVVEIAGAADPAQVSPLKMLRRNERFERLEKALHQLPADRREVLVCAHVHGLSTKEIARRLGRSRGAVGVLLHRAKKDLKDRFGDTASLHLPARTFAPLLLGDGGPPQSAAKRRGWRSH